MQNRRRLICWRDQELGDIDHYIPRFKFRIPIQCSPWIDGEVIQLCGKKASARRKAINFNKQQHWKKYKDFRRQLSKLVRRKQSDYFAPVTFSAKHNPKRFCPFYRAKFKTSLMPSKISFDNSWDKSKHVEPLLTVHLQNPRHLLTFYYKQQLQVEVGLNIFIHLLYFAPLAPTQSFSLWSLEYILKVVHY